MTGPAQPGSLPFSAAEIFAKAGAENFPVAPRLLPQRYRRPLLAIYGFARLVDDIGDEATGERSALLDEVERDLDRAFAGRAQHPVLQRLAAVLCELTLPREPFARLVEANRHDQVVHRYETWNELVDYCTLSANPVGELVLCLFGAATPERFCLSDAICTALQVVEHCQDVAEDWQRGRVYLPAEDLARFGCRVDDLRAQPTPACVRNLLGFEIERARCLLAEGCGLLLMLRGWARLSVTAFVAGGYAATDGMERLGFDLHAAPFRTRHRDFARRFGQLLLYQRCRRIPA
jgi:squalene synthase HpnC